MKWNSFFYGLTMLCFLAISVSSETEITSIDFKVNGGESIIEISGNGPLVYDKSENVEDRQLIIDIDDANLGPNASRKLDTSSFNSPVTLVSPYAIGDEGDQIRVVVQMRDSLRYDVGASSDRITIRVPAPGNELAERSAPKDSGKADDEENSEEDTEEKVADQGVNQEVAAQKNAKDNLQLFMETRSTGNFRGSPITLQVRDADVQDVLRLISEASGFNIILGPQVSGKITLSLVDVPWDQALDVVLHTLKLGAERNYNVLRVLTLANLTAEKRQVLAAKQAAEASAPKITRVFPVSYAEPKDLSKILEKFRKSASGLVSGDIEVDKRTNSIVVRDIKENLDRMEQLIILLDKQTPQVLVDSKIVEATENSTLAAAGSLGFSSGSTGGGYMGPYFTSFGGSNPIDDLIGDADNGGVGTNTGSDIAGTNQGMFFGVQPTLAFLPGQDRLTALLSLEEKESKVKVVSSPRTVVLNKEKAKILQSIPVQISTTSVAEGGNFIDTTEIEEANISLEVTPSVSNDENVHLELSISRDVPVPAAGGGSNAVGKRSIESKVLVQSGSTLVIGGIFISDRTESTSGFPILKDIPLLGVFFGSDTDVTTRSELFIFVTPRILNTKKAGLTS